MQHLHQKLAERVAQWREAGYSCGDYPAIAEILQFQLEPEISFRRFLRQAQLRALKTYWCLRIAEKTADIFELYERLYATSQWLEACALSHSEIRAFVMDCGIDALLERVRTDGFVADFDLETLREAITLEYASYILALAMGAGSSTGSTWTQGRSKPKSKPGAAWSTA